MAKRKMNPKSLENLKNGKEHQFKQGDKKPIEEIEKREQTKKENRTLAGILEMLLQDEHATKSGDKVTGEMMISIALLKEAAKGNVKAYEVIRDTIGQKPVEKQEIVDSSTLNIQVVANND